MNYIELAKQTGVYSGGMEYWCKHCYRNPNKNGHTPFCPATGVEA